MHCMQFQHTPFLQVKKFQDFGVYFSGSHQGLKFYAILWTVNCEI